MKNPPVFVNNNPIDRLNVERSKLVKRDSRLSRAIPVASRNLKATSVSEWVANIESQVFKSERFDLPDPRNPIERDVAIFQVDR